MNVIVANKNRELLGNLDIEVIKSLTGEYSAEQLVDTFSNFFFGRMIIDLTAIQGYHELKNLQKISMALDVEKIIILIPEDNICLQPQYLSKIISMGIYNFTTNIEGVKYLLNSPNTYRDVAHLHQLEQPVIMPGQDNNIAPKTQVINEYVTTTVSNGYIIGVKNLTDHAGASSFSYMLKKAMQAYGSSAICVEVNRRDFVYFNDKDMISVTKEQLAGELLKHRDKNIILDLNDFDGENLCSEVLYLLEPSTIKLNKLMVRDRRVFEKLTGKKIILTNSLLTDKDVLEFEYESKAKVFYNIPPLNDREDNNQIFETLLRKLGLLQ